MQITIASTALGLQASALSLPPIQPICFLITHPHSSMSSSCLHFLNSFSFHISSSFPSSSTFSPFYLSVDLFIPVFMLFTPPAPLTALHPPSSLSLNLQTSPPLQPHQLSLPLASIQPSPPHTSGLCIFLLLLNLPSFFIYCLT